METLQTSLINSVRSDFDRLTQLASFTQQEVDRILGIPYRETPTEHLSGEVSRKMQLIVQIIHHLDMCYASEISLGNIWKRDAALSEWFRFLYSPLDQTLSPLEFMIAFPKGIEYIHTLLIVKCILSPGIAQGTYRSVKNGHILNIL